MITPISYFNDNYAYFVTHNKSAILFDCGDGSSIVTAVEELQCELDQVLLTHNHHDHIDGWKIVQDRFPQSEVIFPVSAKERRFTQFTSIPVEVIPTPGHTLDHLCYYLPEQNALITGDTLFAGGCGRCFSGEFELFAQSLEQLSRLPAETQFYPAHEYLHANVQFIKSQGIDCSFYEHRLANEQKPSVGIYLRDEIVYNPFLKAAATGNVQEFTRLRKLKDQF